ncbi:hypothetical protein ACFFX1_07000 [Dactylosporangium sucinum]|uniref:Uncharacterized protein n=1 Tax=Dactylosporangium sucinum TaxID=1424081 RepID=A0A917UFT5_9ACTN|nr:hypothetical protein [Dactylosporangium sucinum]GGM84251.1 hypothetical protein GCM10007977_102160 [Dactylosporangium sucinum]
MMRNTQRILALAGMTLAAGAVIGMNAGVASAATTQAEKTTVAKPGPNDKKPGSDFRNGDRRGGGDRTWTVGFFKNKKACEWAGKIGKWHGDFDDYDCYRINRKGTNILVAHDYRHRGRHR